MSQKTDLIRRSDDVTRPDLSRRLFLAGTAGTLACLSGTGPASAAIQVADLRGSIDAPDLGLLPDQHADQSSAFQHALNTAVENGRALFLPGGNYPVSNIRFPSGTLIVGVPGRTRLVYQGGGGLLASTQDTSHISLSGVVFDGANRSLGEHTEGLLDFVNVTDLRLEDCIISGSTKTAIVVTRCSGEIRGCQISGAAEAGIWSNEAKGLSLTDNTVQDCAAGGIWIHRWSVGEDGTIVSGNRIERIASRHGGTGQWGNGINVFRAGGVVISGNRIADCAFSAIRSNSGSNVQIIGNSCLRSGEAAIYSEFEFEGAVISNNIVDGATTGISVANFMQGGRMAVVSGNLIRNLSDIGPYPAEVAGFGIGISVEADTTVNGNVIEGAPQYGMLLGWGPYLRNVAVSQNVLKDCRTGIAVTVVEDAGSASIQGNIIQGSKDLAIAGYRWTDQVTGDLSQSNDWEHLLIAGNIVRD
ncbi:TIGR03808 family TAT-translocated repetitive protein [Roseibium sp.]|uniref:TIGR03808 family TAT-translocated repetitive protein n=1 Tax=Roseibium sp. TaxID=1936156 RepID=UPI003A97082A